jgi:hydroxyacylglutathione hydrolase
MTVHSITVGPLEENTYFLSSSQDSKTPGARGVIVDPGAQPERILAKLEELQLTPEAILLTHAHFDHIGAIAGLAHLKLPVYLHPKDFIVYQRSGEAAMRWGIPFEAPTVEPTPCPDYLDFGLGLRVLFVPGHSPGHVAFYAAEGGHLISGDVLFKGAIGRYDLPGANQADLMNSLQTLLQLPPETTVYPGHGPPTTLGIEKRSNPYLQSL